MAVVARCPFLGEGSPTKIDYRKKGTLILTLLEDLEMLACKTTVGPLVADPVFQVLASARVIQRGAQICLEPVTRI